MLVEIISGGILFCNPVHFEVSGMIHYNIDWLTMRKPPHPMVIHFLDMPELMPGKIFMNGFEKNYLVCEERVFIFLDFTGECKALTIGYIAVISPMLVQPRKPSPRHLPVRISVTAEHVGVDAADRKPSVVDPAFVLIKKPA